MTGQATRLEMDADPQLVYEGFLEQGWGDGLPIIPPTEERVAAMLAATTRRPEASIGTVPPGGGVATVEKLAINAVMAGCRPEYFPVVLAALEAVMDRHFNLNGVQATTHGVTPLIVVGGPVVKSLDFNCSTNVFGGGNRANVTVGRALRLAMLNLGGATAGKLDMATMGHPGKISYCIAENQDESMWPPFHVSRGLPEGSSAVTVFGGEGPHSVVSNFLRGPRILLNSAASTMSALGSNNMYLMGEAMLVVGPMFARDLGKAGWSREDVQEYLFSTARKSIGELKQAAHFWKGSWKGHWPDWVDPTDDSCTVPIVAKPGDIHVVVAGGEGRFFAAIPGWGLGGFAVTKAIEPSPKEEER